MLGIPYIVAVDESNKRPGDKDGKIVYGGATAPPLLLGLTEIEDWFCTSVTEFGVNERFGAGGGVDTTDKFNVACDVPVILVALTSKAVNESNVFGVPVT